MKLLDVYNHGERTLITNHTFTIKYQMTTCVIHALTQNNMLLQKLRKRPRRRKKCGYFALRCKKHKKLVKPQESNNQNKRHLSWAKNKVQGYSKRAKNLKVWMLWQIHLQVPTFKLLLTLQTKCTQQFQQSNIKYFCWDCQ